MKRIMSLLSTQPENKKPALSVARVNIFIVTVYYSCKTNTAFTDLFKTWFTVLLVKSR